MIITTVRVGATKNLGNYESAKLEVEAIASEGQTADELIAEVRAYVDQNVGAQAAPAAPAKPAKSTKAEAEAKPAKAEEKKPAKAPGKRPRKAAKPDHEKELTYTLEAESGEELLDRLYTLRLHAECFTLEDYRSAMRKVQEHYRKLNGDGLVDDDTREALVSAFKAELRAIVEREADACDGVAA